MLILSLQNQVQRTWYFQRPSFVWINWFYETIQSEERLLTMNSRLSVKMIVIVNLAHNVLFMTEKLNISNNLRRWWFSGQANDTCSTGWSSWSAKRSFQVTMSYLITRVDEKCTKTCFKCANIWLCSIYGMTLVIFLDEIAVVLEASILNGHESVTSTGIWNVRKLKAGPAKRCQIAILFHWTF